MSEPIYFIPPVRRGLCASAASGNWGMDAMRIKPLRDATDGGKGIKLGINDTGIDHTHPDLAPNFGGSKDFTGSSAGAQDRNGHGTHCSGTVGAKDPNIGVAYNATIFHGKGLGDGGSGGTSILRSIEWLIAQGCKVISNSLGGGGPWPELDQIAQRAWEQEKVWLIFAGGNSGPNTPNTDYPGRSEWVLNVAALNFDLSPASFSSAGDKIDTSGPGVDIISCRPGGGYQSMSGTSMATPWVAGALGCYYQGLVNAGKPIPSVHEMRTKLFTRSTDTHTPGDDRRTGPGWVTPMLLTLDLEPSPLPVGE